LVCGPKNSGKSTFSRNLVEVLLQRYKRVAYLDTDVGQPEFTAPGFLSLTIVDKSILGNPHTYCFHDSCCLHSENLFS
jgi:polynucleotide 5'-hydroxyl-kinase GRC3/NOL9